MKTRIIKKRYLQRNTSAVCATCPCYDCTIKGCRRKPKVIQKEPEEWCSSHPLFWAGRLEQNELVLVSKEEFDLAATALSRIDECIDLIDHIGHVSGGSISLEVERLLELSKQGEVLMRRQAKIQARKEAAEREIDEENVSPEEGDKK